MSKTCLQIDFRFKSTPADTTTENFQFLSDFIKVQRVTGHNQVINVGTAVLTRACQSSSNLLAGNGQDSEANARE